ncbi:E3 ubiquitin-protein ligase RNF181 isoform X1 [Hydra vulgaris]|uniref:E3 ubiquitin-protein ligase RNF181 n=1 Tax=Hydra vulgaris TaxID=6087 RepID=T2M434_HYDVU|nr:E3 ubiquitin-protein ligase RNF181 [Hydra vulgaris]
MSTQSNNVESWDSLEIARIFLATFQMSEELESSLQGKIKNPPASKQFLANLSTVCRKSESCPICLKVFEEKSLVKELPKCKHSFHATCILPWLYKTNTCPMCRYEYPTDDFEYEEKRRLKEKESQREEMLEELHNSMFS